MKIQDAVVGVEVDLNVCENVAWLRLRGVIDAAALAEVKRWTLQRLVDWPVSGFYVDYTGAVVNCTRQELDAIFGDEGPASQAVVPAAMLVRENQLALFQAHCWSIAWSGVVRGVFLDPGKALRWLRERAAAAAQIRPRPAL